jgi:hypothetical protein
MKKPTKTITRDVSPRSVQLRVDVRYLRIPAQWYVEEIPASDIRPDPSTTSQPTDAPYFRERFIGFEDGWGRTDVRGVKIPARKSDSPDWQYALVPVVDQSAWEAVELDPFDLRTQFLKLDIDDQKKTTDFLSNIGVWNINEQVGTDSMRIERTVGQRYVSGFASAFPVGDLRLAQERARRQMESLEKDPKRLRAEFRQLEQQAGNPLRMPPLYFEWRGDPAAIVQPITGHEMLNVTLQFDLITDAGVYVCEKCTTRFTSDRKRRYCSDLCMKASAQQAMRVRNREKRDKGKGWRKTV